MVNSSLWDGDFGEWKGKEEEKRKQISLQFRAAEISSGLFKRKNNFENFLPSPL